MIATSVVATVISTIVLMVICRVDSARVLRDRAATHIGKLIVSHLHQLALVLDLPLRQLKRLVCHGIARRCDDLGHVLARHQEILLRLLVLEVAMW